MVVQNAPLRLVGMAGYDLLGENEPEQLLLFEPGALTASGQDDEQPQEP